MKKYLKIFLTVVIGVLIAYAFIWSIYVQVRYKPFVKALDGQKYLEEEGYVYYIKKPSFPSFTGNLSITESRNLTKEDNECIYAYLIIWPRFWGGYGVAANVGKTTVDYDNRHSHTDAYGIMLDENRKPDYSVPNVYEIYTENKELFDSNMDRIDNLYERAYEKWNILGAVVETEDAELKKMSDQELVSAIADYPYLVDIYAYDSIGEGIDKLAENCDAYAELISRESGKNSMLKYGEQIVNNSNFDSSRAGREEFVSYAIKDIMEYLENN